MIANFDSGAKLDMEHTSTRAGHQHWADDLIGDRMATLPPACGKYTSREELLEATNPWGSGGWVSVEKEAFAQYALIFAAMQKKIKAHPPGGVMVLEGECHTNDLTMPEVIKAASYNIRGVPGSEKWTYCFFSRGNHIDFYSTIFSPTIPFQDRRPPPPDPNSIKKFFRNEDGSPYEGPWPPESLQS